MFCHSCSHYAAIHRGDYNSTPWDEVPCSSCKLVEDTFYSIPLDPDRPPDSADDPTVLRTKTSVPLAQTMPVAIFADFIEALMSLPPEQRDVVAWRFQGLRYQDIAKRHGTSIQLAEMRHKIAMRDFPILLELFPEKTAKRRRLLSKR